jgi:hypothetical protein
MRPVALQRRNSAFVRSSGLGEMHNNPVIESVSIRRGNAKPIVIVKDGTIFKQKLGYRKYDPITFDAKVRGTGYFYGTVNHNGLERLIFITPAQRNISYTIELELPLEGLNFHISPTIPTTLDPTYLDSASRNLLKNNPASYSTLGFFPTEPMLGQKDSDTWSGKISEHSWKYGRSGTAVTKGQDVHWLPNYDGGWLGTASMYKYDPKIGWECIQQSSAYLQVGQPHCIVGQLVGYRDTYGIGGEYHYYTNSGGEAWSGGATLRGDRIRLMNTNYRNHYGVEDHGERAGKNNFKIQSYNDYVNGGEVPINFTSGWWFPTSDHPDGADSDQFCAKVEWWNPETNIWSTPSIYPPWETKINGKGQFAFYFRFPRQLTEQDEYFEKTPQWKIDQTWHCYPYQNSDSGSDNFLGVEYSRIGRPNTPDNKSIAVEKNGYKLVSSSTSPAYSIMIAPESKSQDGDYEAHENQKKCYIPVSANIMYYAVDPFAYSYSANPDILKAYWKNGSFKPGGTFMLMGKACNWFPAYWISTDSLKTDKKTPMDLNIAQFDLIRGSHKPNDFSADKISSIRFFKATDIDDPKKVSQFQSAWDECFPGVPFTKPMLVAMIRGDQLPELEGIKYERLPGFIEDDPLRYEVDYEGVKYRHPYSLALCKIPEGWWGPTISEDSNVSSVYIGGQNHYYYVFEEYVDLAEEIAAQKALEEAGLNAAEQFAASELENEMKDITFDAYRAHNETIKESVNAEVPTEGSWLFRREPVTLRHRYVSLLGSAGTVTDVTDRYSADQITSLDGLSAKNTRQYGFTDLYLVNGPSNGPSTVIMPPKEPTGKTPLKVSNTSGFGNSERQALKARALGNGNPMKYSTEAEQDSNKPSFEADQMGGAFDLVLGVEEGTVAGVATTVGWALAGLATVGVLLKIKPTLDRIATAASDKRAAKYREQTAQAETISAIRKLRE